MDELDLAAMESLPLVQHVPLLVAEVERLREWAAEAVKRLDGADYDLGRVLADGEADNDRIRDAWQGVREARALLGGEKELES